MGMTDATDLAGLDTEELEDFARDITREIFSRSHSFHPDEWRDFHDRKPGYLAPLAKDRGPPTRQQRKDRLLQVLAPRSQDM